MSDIGADVFAEWRVVPEDASIHFRSYSDYLKPLRALVLYFNFSVAIIRAAGNSQIAINFQGKCKYLSEKFTFQNSPKIKRSIFSQLKSKFLVSIT